MAPSLKPFTLAQRACYQNVFTPNNLHIFDPSCSKKFTYKIFCWRFYVATPATFLTLGSADRSRPWRALEALFASWCMASIATVSAAEALFLKLDMRGGFDNVSNGSMASFLASLPNAAALEASRLLALLLHQTFRLFFPRDEWEIICQNGTAQSLSEATIDYSLTVAPAMGG